MSPRSAVIASIAIALHAVAVVAHAQGGVIELRAAATDSSRIDGGSVFTSVFTVKNPGSDTARIQPTLLVPHGWTIVMGNAAFAVAPGKTETWLVGVSVPGSAPAAVYAVRGALIMGGTTVSDSILVHVNEHRAIEILSLDVPGWVMAGSRYEARFLVRNRGNVPSTVALSGSTGRGKHVDADPASTTIAPGTSATVTVRVAMAGTVARTTDDVLELAAVDQADPRVRVTAFARTTVVPHDVAGSLATVPGMLSLRSIGGASGVSPVALAAAGMLADNTTAVDVRLQSPTGRDTPYGFGERDEYRANFKATKFSLNLGDNAYGFSPLTSSGMMGTGAEFDGTAGGLPIGAYAQQLRWIPGSVREEGVFLGTAPDSARGLSTTFVERQSTDGPVSVGSIGGRARLPLGATIQLEAATSDSSHTSGAAESARLAGTLSNVSYDIGVLHGSTDFVGMARGTTTQDGVVTTRLGTQIAITASGSIRASDFSTPLSGVPAQRFAMTNIGASYGGGLAMLEYGWLSRHDDGTLTPLDGTQHGLRATSSLPLGQASLSVSYERGTVNADIETAGRPYDVVTVTAQTKLWDAGNLSVFGAHDDGNTLTGSTNGVANVGVSLELHLPFYLELVLSTTAQRATLGVFDGSGSWFSQSDARLDYAFAGGQSLSLHERIWQNPSVQGSVDASAIYLEFRTPIRLPVGPARVGGRAEGRITDAATGRPLVGALVRIGDQAAVTDKDGRVAFSGLASARERVSIDATGAAAGALLVGDAFVDTRDQSRHPVMFALSVARGGSVRVLVRILGPALGTLAANKDSMVTVGMEPNVLVALMGAHDTLYQSSDDRGRVDFGSVAPGVWTLVVMPGELPDHHVFEADRIEVTVKSGERRDVELRLVPQKRTVTIIGHEIPLTAKRLP
jgi:hypothetical protein